jgi:hypothetical protein
MARPNTCDTSGLAFGGMDASGMSPADVEQYKLDRLQELRAFVDSLRSQHDRELLADVRAEHDQFCGLP